MSDNPTTTKLQLTKDPEYFTKYYLKNNKVRHNGLCQSDICMNQRQNLRVAPRDRYTNNNFSYCSSCATTYPSTNVRCPCCSHILRIKSKYTSKNKKIVRY